MKASLEILKGLDRSLTVDLPIDIFNQKTDKILQKIASQVNFDGFRKGKVPVAVVRKRFGNNVNSDAINEIVNETLTDALTQVKATPVSQPVISKIDSEDEKNFSYTVDFEVFPEIKVADFSKLTIEQIKVEITKADEQRTLNGLKEQLTEYKAVKRKSEIGDRLSIDFKGLIDGKTFDGAEAKDFKIVLGKGSMIKGFEEGLIDVTPNSMLMLDLVFPKNYHMNKLSGKAVTFEININEVALPKEPKLNEVFAKKFGEKDMDALKVSIKMQMKVEIDGRIGYLNKNAIFDALSEANQFDVPQSSIDNEAQNLLKEMKERIQQQGGLPAQGEIPASAFNDEAQRRVKLGLLVNQISNDNKLSASLEQIDAKLQEISQAHGKDTQKIIDSYNQDPTKKLSIELLVIEKMVQDLILDKAKVTFKQKKFQEIT
ncbi:trigger factor [Candidatus Ruthia magnifica str. Cm (Calyptogena magnifica)]|uniref:Trigger factor n=1 Tax=Ruthia magnifica subsp. Calyptogena magnifica TaxID=413404 RepID=TIG_RUTMC|nr:trigger factor [Candidatus Ruthturnera calyptogenae]A1AVN5.1 RecName: Full=Trigger factor; Short=TF; AltName: Full=PPIase [Candidatus Ruthia magnifica str. Cm (Calyptogena magnifica)]ABL01992.1 trigger factor [Candidatus Ruthia magnifica str. Cm (Calyptogena magnifica)]